MHHTADRGTFDQANLYPVGGFAQPDLHETAWRKMAEVFLGYGGKPIVSFTGLGDIRCVSRSVARRVKITEVFLSCSANPRSKIFFLFISLIGAHRLSPTHHPTSQNNTLVSDCSK